MSSGVTKRFFSEDGTLHVVKQQDVEGALEAIKELQGAPKNSGQIEHGRHIGSVPVLLAYQFMKECGAAIGTPEWNAYAAKKLRTAEYAHLRVHG